MMGLPPPLIKYKTTMKTCFLKAILLIFIINKNDNIHKNKVQDVRRTDVPVLIIELLRFSQGT